MGMSKIKNVIRASLFISFLWALTAPAQTAPTSRPAVATTMPIIQRVHQKIVPHVDRKGQVLHQYDPAKSFFLLSLWGQVEPTDPGGPYTSWKQLADDGFNAVWGHGDLGKVLPLAKDSGVQFVLMGKIPPDQAKQFNDHPALLGNMWMDEPTGRADVEQLWNDYQIYKKHMKEIAPGIPVFVNDSPAISPPHLLDWWLKWNVAGDISCQDIYPLQDRTERARTLANFPHDMAEVVSLAVSENKGVKPVWTIVAAFTLQGKSSWPFRFPTPQQLRAEVYTSIIHGSTGIAYFIMDSAFSRRGEVIGMSPDPKPRHGDAHGGTFPTAMEMINAKALWQTAKQINAELKELTPTLLTPTVGDDYVYKVSYTGKGVSKTPIRTMLKPHQDGGYVLLTVNLDDAVLDVTFEFPAALKSAQLMFENQPPKKLAAPATSFTEHFEPFETHIYRIVPSKHE